jgi:hypothetical protein
VLELIRVQQFLWVCKYFQQQWGSSMCRRETAVQHLCSTQVTPGQYQGNTCAAPEQHLCFGGVQPCFGPCHWNERRGPPTPNHQPDVAASTRKCIVRTLALQEGNETSDLADEILSAACLGGDAFRDVYWCTTELLTCVCWQHVLRQLLHTSALHAPRPCS